MATATSLHLSAQGWVSKSKLIEQCIQDLNNHGPQYLLLSDNAYSNNEQLQPELMARFDVPGHLLATMYRRSNGFFYSRSQECVDGKLVAFHSWYRVLVKVVYGKDVSSYRWHEITIFTRWGLSHNSILCIGADTEFVELLKASLECMWNDLPPDNPWALQIPLLEALVALHDQAVWSIRDAVRDVEKNRHGLTGEPDDFERLHEAARHTTHSFETLGVSLETFSALQEQAVALPHLHTQQDEGAGRDAKCIQRHIASQLRMAKALLFRSQANRDRLQNEISHAYNMIAQRDSQTMTKLGRAARTDSGAMRTIAVVTMAFLPPTFLSAIFSMSFFTVQPDKGSGQGDWGVSRKFWVYWAFAVPLTSFTLAIWLWRERCERKRGSQSQGQLGV